MKQHKKILAFVGMPGAGKTEAVAYLQNKGISFVRFGDLTDETLKELGMEMNPENEKFVREKLRKDAGMAAFAIKAEPRIKEMLHDRRTMVIDGLYSWEEYVYLKKLFPELILVHVYAEPDIRHARLAKRKVRPFPLEKSRERDIAEIEQLNKGGPIAIADHLILNNGDDIQELYAQIDTLLQRFGAV